MSLFDDLETTKNVYLPNDSDITKKITWDYETADFTIAINIIQMGAEEQMIYEQELATYRANVDSANASLLVKGARIGTDGAMFEITNDPKPLKLFPGTYSIRLRSLNEN